MNKVYLSLGSNEGDREQWLQRAIDAIGERCGTIAARSSVYETSAWGIEDQPGFLNMVLKVTSSLTPNEVLSEIQQIEMQLGRQRSVKWGQRTLDIDILLYDDEIIDDEDLVIPHPYLHQRRFTLEPLNEIAGGLVHPIWKKTISELLQECTDPLEAKRIS